MPRSGNIITMRSITFLLILPFLHASAQSTIGDFIVEDHLVSATHSGGCNTQHLIGPPDNMCMVNMVDGHTITGYFGSMWPDRPGIDLIYENCYTTGDASIRMILADGSFTEALIVPFNGFDSLANANWTFTAVPSCATQFLFGNSSRKIVGIDLADFFLSAIDSVQGIEIEFLPGFNTDPAGVYIVSDPSVAIPEHEPSTAMIITGGSIELHGIAPGARILFFDHMGRIIHGETSLEDVYRSNISQWPAGAYIARIEHGTGSRTIRIAKGSQD